MKVRHLVAAVALAASASGVIAMKPNNEPITPNSRFDQWLLGNQKALTTKELAGYKLFKDSGCVACHNGEAVDVMGRIQLGKKFTRTENENIVAFLKTLTGDQPSFTMPILPPSSDATPRPTPFAK